MSRLLFSLAFAFVLTAPVQADGINSLTPKEIAAGSLLLFDGVTTFGWKTDGPVKVEGGMLVLGGDKPASITPTTAFRRYRLGYTCTVTGKEPPMLEILGRKFPIRQVVDGIPVPEGVYITHSKSLSPGSDENRVTIKFGNQEIEEFDLPPSVPFKFSVPPGSMLKIHTISLTPWQDVPKLFNGKNLDGWKVTQTDPKRTATKFEVTKAGELSAKNGPGDLQTEKQFDDFVLQFECKTNGLALNSGIFFRCMPDAYQNGYEAQIQNAYLGDRTKPIDYGTGAIYRRIAARKVVSNDNEWFTMTVAARGAHIATWVNGYQTVDWTDDRKANDNPRQGLRTAKGHLSIQGHDPTTDLLFRNIRIAELPKQE